LVRALARPYPGAFSYLLGKRYLIWNAALLPSSAGDDGPAGKVIGPCYSPLPEACGQVVRCSPGFIMLLEVETEEARPLKGAELSEQNWVKLTWTNEKS
jgi:methionyl-tRNA formyltransferase